MNHVKIVLIGRNKNTRAVENTNNLNTFNGNN